MSTVYICRGLPACGKSSLGERMAESNKNLRLVAKDDIRKMLYRNAKWNASKEPLVQDMRDAIIHELLGQKFDVFVHDTNLTGNHIERITEIANEYDADISIIDMTSVSIEDCIKRDALREHSVGYRIIIGMAERYLGREYELFRLRYPTTQSILEMLYLQRHIQLDNDKKNAIIVDIDGTIAIMGDRSPYDFTKVHEDKLYRPLAAVLDSLSEEYTIIFLSGRDIACYNETKAWLEDNELWYFDSSLFMREDGDNRPDSEVKEQLWREQVNIFYNVIAWFDDRKQVVAHMRTLGLPIWQVNWGDF